MCFFFSTGFLQHEQRDHPKWIYQDLLVVGTINKETTYADGTVLIADPERRLKELIDKVVEKS